MFAARYDVGAVRPVQHGDVAVLGPAELAERLAKEGSEVTAVGDGATRYLAELERAGVVVRGDVAVPLPSAALRLVALRAAAGEVALHHHEVHPTYLREADAVANFTVRTAAK